MVNLFPFFFVDLQTILFTMKKLQFKTNINCGNCVAKVTPFLNEIKGIDKWEVKTDQPDKMLVVEGEVNEVELVEAVKNAGFNIEPKKGFFGKFF